MRMLELRRDLDFTLEALAVHPRGELRRQHLDDDLPAERVFGRRKDATHTGANQLVVYPVIGSERCGEAVAEVVGHGERRGTGRSAKWLKLRGGGVARNVAHARASLGHIGPSHRFSAERSVTHP